MVFQQVVELASDQPEMKTVHDITAHWNVSAKTARRWLQRQVFEGAVQVGREWRIPASSIRNPDTSRIPVGGAKKKNPGQ